MAPLVLRALALLLPLPLLTGAAPGLRPPQPPAFPLNASLDAEAALSAAVAAAWGGRGGVRCATARLLRGLTGVPGLAAADALQQLDALGGAFARVDPLAAGASELVAALLALPDDGALQLPTEALDGANVWLLQALNSSLAAAGSPVTLWGVHAPDALWQSGQVTQDALNSYLLDTLGFDCVLDASLEAASSAARFALLHPHEAFGYAVVARLPAVASIDAAARLWTWVRHGTPVFFTCYILHLWLMCSPPRAICAGAAV